MRHNKNFNHLGRQAGHRKALLANMATALVMHKRIETTVAKAKALKRYVEPIVTKAKDDSTHSRRIAFSYLRDKDAVTELFRVVAPAVGTRPGGYTRILKIGFRLGDAADMCMIELVDFAPTGTAATGATAAPKTRTRRSSGAKTAISAAEGETTVTATPKSKPSVQKNAAPRVSGAKTVARKTAASKKA